MLKQLNRNKKKKGFTLIELVIVLAVLAIIALIAIPNFTKVREDSQVKSDLRSLESIEKVVDMAIIDEKIKDTTTGSLKVLFDASGKLVSITVPGAIDSAAEADVKKGLEKVNAPQEKGKLAYEIPINNGVITVNGMTTTAN